MSDWPDDRKAELKRLHASPLTYQQIANHMGITRSAVSGEVRRLGLAARAPSGGPRKPSQPREPKMATPMPQKIEAVPIAPVPLLQAPPMACRFPVWTDQGAPDFPVCGAPRAPGQAYCDKHSRIAFQVQARRAS